MTLYPPRGAEYAFDESGLVTEQKKGGARRLRSDSNIIPSQHGRKKKKQSRNPIKGTMQRR